MRHSLRITGLLLAAGLVVLAAGCGGSNSSAPPTTSSTGSFASAKNCLAFAGLAAQVAKTMSASYSASPGAAADELQALADAAPSDIKGDLQTIAAAFSDYLQAVQDSGYTFGSTTPPTQAQIAALVSAARVFNTAKLTAAEQRLAHWEKQNCK